MSSNNKPAVPVKKDSAALVADIQGTHRTRNLRFPSPPTVLVKLNAALNSDHTTVADVVNVVQMHPILSAKILQVANSSLVSRGKEIVSLHDAVQLLGAAFVRNLGLSLALRERFNPVNALVAQAAAEIWNYSVRVGSVALMLSRFLDERALLKSDGSLVLVVGVIHRVGELPLVDFAMTHGYDVQTALSLDQVLRDELTRQVLESWELPLAIREAVLGDGTHGWIHKYARAYVAQVDPEDTLIPPGLVEINAEDFKTYMKAHEKEAADLTSAFA